VPSGLRAPDTILKSVVLARTMVADETENFVEIY